jgi:hypothetical protein
MYAPQPPPAAFAPEPSPSFMPPGRSVVSSMPFMTAAPAALVRTLPQTPTPILTPSPVPAFAPVPAPAPVGSSGYPGQPRPAQSLPLQLASLALAPEALSAAPSLSPQLSHASPVPATPAPHVLNVNRDQNWLTRPNSILAAMTEVQVWTCCINPDCAERHCVRRSAVGRRAGRVRIVHARLCLRVWSRRQSVLEFLISPMIDYFCPPSTS